MADVGKQAPDFALLNQDGQEIRLRDLAGRTVVLFAYPKANTPGCTIQACGVRDAYAQVERAGALVLGLSPDPVARLQRWREKENFPYDLLSDPDHAVLEAYGAWGEKMMYGRKTVGVIRSTVTVGPDGRVARIWPKVRVKGHVDKVLEAVKEL